MFKFVQPSEMKNDFVYTLMVKRRMEKLKHHLQACAEQDAGLLRWDSMLREEHYRMLLHPVLVNWMDTRLFPAFQGGIPEKPVSERLLEEFARLVLIPLWRHEDGPDAAVLRTDAEGVVYFPGCATAVDLGVEAKHMRVTFAKTGDTVWIAAGERRCEVGFSELTGEKKTDASILRRLGFYEHGGIQFGGSDPLVEVFLERELPEIIQSYGKEKPSFPAIRSVPLADIWYYEKAMDLIKTVWPQMYREASAHVRTVYLLDTQEIGALTHNLFQGAIFMSHRSDLMWTTENLIHEFGHARLDQLFELDDLLLNGPDERYPSPWREDLRPLKGVLHGLFVFVRIGLWYELVEAAVPHADISSRRQRVLAQIGQALDILSQHARWTAFGEQLFSELSEQYDRLVSAAAASNPTSSPEGEIAAG
ncbi:HEXXH motif-containing putative peptide modification protein [Paenibacillus sp. P96]|uniref:HEXXH motif-containing putative peptide modification protein n=1 Tax=Paenibacillus zeirhizosphaerae TaxID=2987519 RepID=A0ABT9FMU3_9BACL|nr:HEXXH motif-containing putative peptide modification protein [Paenibacillus sp. P96]MDP4096028.1 HEXXH motif-containing putative peptide modification protein [Paenibacillus sp. P96]